MAPQLEQALQFLHRSLEAAVNAQVALQDQALLLQATSESIDKALTLLGNAIGQLVATTAALQEGSSSGGSGVETGAVVAALDDDAASDDVPHLADANSEAGEVVAAVVNDNAAVEVVAAAHIELSDQADFDKNTHDNNENNNVAAAVVQDAEAAHYMFLRPDGELTTIVFDQPDPDYLSSSESGDDWEEDSRWLKMGYDRYGDRTLLFGFGRHKDRPVIDVALTDRSYLLWMLDAERSDFDEYTRALVRSVLEMVPPPDSRWFEWRADGAGGWTPFFKFGMHKGRALTDVAIVARSYLSWMLDADKTKFDAATRSIVHAALVAAA